MSDKQSYSDDWTKVDGVSGSVKDPEATQPLPSAPHQNPNTVPPLFRSNRVGSAEPGSTQTQVAGPQVGASVPLVAPSGVASAPPRPNPKVPGSRRSRKTQVRLARIQPWTVMKMTLLFSVAVGIMSLVAVWVLWTAIQASGLFDSLNEIMNTALGNPDGTSNFRLDDYLNTNRILGYTTLLAAINIVIMTTLATLLAFLYNMGAVVMGGIELTLADD